MILIILGVLIGLVMVMLGAQGLTDGASAVASRLRVPPIVVGLTIVALGTSAPEFFISLTSTLRGTSDIAVGNVVGSNIFNTLLIVGVSAIAAPMFLHKSTVTREIPMSVVAAVLLFGLTLDRELSRLEALLLFAIFLGFMIYTVRKGLRERTSSSEEQTSSKKTFSWVRSCAYIILGLVGLIYGSDLFVDRAIEIAHRIGVSDAVIGLTIVAGGTSLPELATSVVAARKGQSEIAMGNVIGSNIFNILMILGITGLITPLHLYEIKMLDLLVMLGSAVIVWIFSYTRFTIERWEGFVLTAGFVGYITYLLCNI